MNRVWYPALRRAGIRARKASQTRHTFATLALSAGEAIGWVSKQMGHSNTKIDHRALLPLHPQPDPPGRLGIR